MNRLLLTCFYRFVDEYYKEKWRGYGGNVVTVFDELRKENCAQPHSPATKQFDGQVNYKF